MSCKLGRRRPASFDVHLAVFWRRDFLNKMKTNGLHFYGPYRMMQERKIGETRCYVCGRLELA